MEPRRVKSHVCSHDISRSQEHHGVCFLRELLAVQESNPPDEYLVVMSIELPATVHLRFLFRGRLHLSDPERTGANYAV
jgi:hypothetical protein